MSDKERTAQAERIVRKFMLLNSTEKAFIAGYMARAEEESETEMITGFVVRREAVAE